MPNESEKQLLEFPCEFPIKIMGKATDSFESAVLSIINKHVDNLLEGAIQINKSSKGNYAAITVTIAAQSREQLDNIYLDLTACKQVIMAL